jgi:His/Glu/Gln/Arg/opine family amino acid ABC transporter permease subunit
MELFNTDAAIANFGLLTGGLLITVELTAVVFVLSLIFGLIVALGRMSSVAWLRGIIWVYIEVIRGTPLLLQLVYIYYVLPELGLRLDAFSAGVLGLTLHNAAYLSEVYRGSILAVPFGQRDAAAALGMTPLLAMRRIVLPQAIRVAIPTLGNYLIGLFKETSLCSVITIQETMFRAEMSAARNYQYFTLYTLVACMYLAVSFPAARVVNQLERWGARGYRRAR